jgi:hypothetical protein
VGMKDRLRKLQEAAREQMIVIPQRDGTEARFPASEGIKAFMNLMDRLGAGADAPPEHPLVAAARNSSDPKWSGSFYAANDPVEWVKPIDDLSE